MEAFRTVAACFGGVAIGCAINSAVQAFVLGDAGWAACFGICAAFFGGFSVAGLAATRWKGGE